MTPEREKYLAKCGNNEKVLRAVLDNQKQGVKSYKHILNNDSLMSKAEMEYVLDSLRNYKSGVSLYRHELNRLKGMNNVVVPRQVRMATYPASHGFGFGYECVFIGLCVCGAPLRDDECKYCQKCGKRVLWERVK